MNAFCASAVHQAAQAIGGMEIGFSGQPHFSKLGAGSLTAGTRPLAIGWTGLKTRSASTVVAQS
jgi:hypothetical protein